jgi:Uma2 family endonuclease
MIAVDLEDLSVADLIESLGGIPPERIRLRPAPGLATEADALKLLEAPRKRLCELIDGVLVEKTMGFRESFLAGLILRILGDFVDARGLGIVIGEAGMIRLYPGRLRIPDVAFYAWDRFPDRRIPDDPIPAVAPDLAVEVLSPSNTPKEMALKRRDYFAAGVRLVWEVDPKTRTVAVYTGPKRHRVLGETDTLGAGDVLPGFALPVRDLFADLERRAGT